MTPLSDGPLLVLELQAPSEIDPVRPGVAPARFDVRLRNAGNGRLWVNKSLATGHRKHAHGGPWSDIEAEWTVWFEMRVGARWVDPNDCKIDYGMGADEGDFQVLEPGQAVAMEPSFHCFSDLRNPGVYDLIAHYRDDVKKRPKSPAGATYLGGEIVSAPVKIVVLEPPTVETAISAFRSLVAQGGSATFLSQDGTGHYLCTKQLAFLPNGAVAVTEAGCAAKQYRGTYAINDKGDISMRFPDHGSDVDAVLELDSRSLLLLPKVRDRRDFEMWPYREATAAKRARARDGNRE